MERSTARAQYEARIIQAARQLSLVVASASNLGEAVAEEEAEMMRAILRTMLDSSIRHKRYSHPVASARP